MLGRDGLASRRVRLDQHLLHHAHTFLDRRPGATGALDGHVTEGRARLVAVDVDEEADLRRLAAQPDEQHAGEVRVLQIAPQRALQDVEAIALGRHAAAAAMDEGGDAVDVRVVLQRVARSAERRIGTVSVSTGRSRWSPYI